MVPAPAKSSTRCSANGVAWPATVSSSWFLSSTSKPASWLASQTVITRGVVTEPRTEALPGEIQDVVSDVIASTSHEETGGRRRGPGADPCRAATVFSQTLGSSTTGSSGGHGDVTVDRDSSFSASQ